MALRHTCASGGIHYDCSNNGTAGCLGIVNSNDLVRIVNEYSQFKGRHKIKTMSVPVNVNFLNNPNYSNSPDTNGGPIGQ